MRQIYRKGSRLEAVRRASEGANGVPERAGGRGNNGLVGRAGRRIAGAVHLRAIRAWRTAGVTRCEFGRLRRGIAFARPEHLRQQRAAPGAGMRCDRMLMAQSGRIERRPDLRRSLTPRPPLRRTIRARSGGGPRVRPSRHPQRAARAWRPRGRGGGTWGPARSSWR